MELKTPSIPWLRALCPSRGVMVRLHSAALSETSLKLAYRRAATFGALGQLVLTDADALALSAQIPAECLSDLVYG